MPKVVEITSRNTTKDCESMTLLLNEQGWVVVNGVVRSFSVGMGIYNQVKPGTVSVFSPTEEAQRWLPRYPGMARNTCIMTPYVMLAHQTLRYGLFGLNQIAGGTIVGITGYLLTENG